MLDLNDLRLFVHVVDSQSFTRAAHNLRIPKSSISRRIAAFEAAMGATLIERHSRRFELTEIGRDVYERGLEVVAVARSAEEFVQDQTAEPTGLVRFSTSIAFGQYVVPDLLPRFIRQYPKVRLAVEIANRPVDSVAQGFDVLLRAHTWPLEDSSLVQRRVCVIPMITVASPSYLDRAGRPKRVQDLSRLDIMPFGFQDEIASWSYADAKNRERRVAFTPKLQMTDMFALRKAALLDLGITQLPDYLCRDDLMRGRLERVLPDWNAVASIATLLTPSRRGTAPPVKALVGFLAEELPKAVATPAVFP